MQLRWIFHDMIGPANRAQLAAISRPRADRAHKPSCASTAFCDGPVISRHMRGVGSSFCGFRIS